MPASTALPIWQIHADIVGTLRAGNRLVLVAPTGSGKTTQVPQMLLDAGLAGDKKLVVLQPRRVAARTVAARVAWERGGKLGAEVGYQIRFDDHTSLGTRICFVTEGILLRWLQDDHTLANVGAVLFDEFHERNLLSDVSLALVKRLQQTQRPDLKMVVMSATLDAEPVADYLECGDLSPLSAGDLSPSKSDARASLAEPLERGSALPTSQPSGESGDKSPHAKTACPILISEGRSYPVEVRYLDCGDLRPIPEQAADAVERIVNSGEPGDILVFMPGKGEINGTIGALRSARTNERLACIPLHGDLEPQDQDRAFAPNPLRKVVVATNVAETSVTIDGIRHVVDGGIARVARYDAERGIGTLLLEDISRASADQRKGRAGRTAPGTCHRLWTASANLNRSERNTPEIQRSDLAEVVLLLHSLGIQRAADFDWLDKPDPQAVERAERLLVMLGALSPVAADVRRRTSVDDLAASPPPHVGGYEGSDLTSVGRQMLRLPMHPRYSRMLLEASRRGCVPAAALCAALVSGRDLFVRLGRDDAHIKEARELFEASPDSDFFTLMRAYDFAEESGFAPERCRRYGVNAQVARQVQQTCDQIMQVARQQRLVERREPRDEGETESQVQESKVQSPKSKAQPADDDALLYCLMAGFIDQLAKRRDQGTLECDLTEGRHGTLVRESVVHDSPLFVTASIREIPSRGAEPLTLLTLASAVKREWIQEMFPQHLHGKVEHLFDRTHKRVAAVKLIRFGNLVIHQEHQRDVEPAASGRCLAEAHAQGCFELPLLNHEVKQFMARVNLVCAAMPDLDFPPFDAAAITACLARAFAGLSLVKEAQATQVRAAFAAHLAPEQRGWLDELTPLTIPWPGGRLVKLNYSEESDPGRGAAVSPEVQVKLQECFALPFLPLLCEGTVPVRLWLTTPDGKRLTSTCDWPHFKSHEWPKLRPAVTKKFPSVTWG